MEKYEKIAESLANGRLYVTPNIFDNDDWDLKIVYSQIKILQNGIC